MAMIDPTISMNQARKEQAGQKDGSGNVKHEPNVLREIQAAKTECFGGKMFRRKDEHGHSIVSFAVDKMSEREEEQLQRHYGEMISALPAYVAHRGGPSSLAVGDYTVFNFMIDSETFSLREWIEKNPGDCGRIGNLMQTLTNVIIEAYNHFAAAGMRYQPLNCLTMDTVFVNTSSGRVTLLPLVPVHGKYAAGLAPEVYLGESGDVTADLYAAAYLTAYVAASGKPKRGDVSLPGMLLNCMQAIPAYRPDLQTVRAELQGQAKTTATGTAETPRGEDGFAHRAWSGAEWLQKLRENWKKFCAKLMTYVPEECESKAQTAGTVKRAAYEPARKVAPIETITSDQKE